jgi:hypothetical protein
MDAGLVLFAVALVIVGLISLVSNIRTRQAFNAQRERSLREASDEVRSQVAAMASDILELTDRVAVFGNPRAAQLFAEATAAYQDAQDQFERSSNIRELERVSDELDHARWQIESARAMVEGRELPPEPDVDRACFFDPTHGAGTHHASIDTAAGRRDVRVCSYCATKLRSGHAPEPRMIEVGGQQVPAAKAPRSHGGSGMEWLGDFSIVLGDLRRPYGWGGYGGVPGSSRRRRPRQRHSW